MEQHNEENVEAFSPTEKRTEEELHEAQEEQKRRDKREKEWERTEHER